MLLYHNSILKLEYDPSTDILEMTWPDLTIGHLSEVKQALQTMVETVRDYDIKKLLVDGTKASITIPDQDHTELDLKLAKDFTSTRLQKIARIESTDFKREFKAEKNRHTIHQNLNIPFLMQNFPDRTSALNWLNEAF
ncbi:hypothetical protein [Rufibacter tibetensis]|nr:hypothetical protein [Rufibacter tibetensis]